MDSQDLVSAYLNGTKTHFIFSKYIYAYKGYLDTKTDLSASTKKDTLLALHNFDKYLMLYFSELKDITELKPNHVNSYIRFNVSDLLLKNRTINGKLRAIKNFLNYLCNVRGLIEFNPALGIAYLKVEEENLPSFMPKNTLLKLISELERKKYGIRDSVITKFLAYMGMQLKEIIDLKMDQIDSKNRIVTLTRDNIEYKYDILDDLYKSLKSYILIRNQELSSDYSEYLFLSNKGSHYTSRSYQYAFKEALINGNIENYYTPRHVKASFAYHMAQVIPREKLKQILNQDKVDHYYIDDIKNNPLLPK